MAGVQPVLVEARVRLVAVGGGDMPPHIQRAAQRDRVAQGPALPEPARQPHVHRHGGAGAAVLDPRDIRHLRLLQRPQGLPAL